MIRRVTLGDVETVSRLHWEVRVACLPYLPDLHTAASTLAYFRNQVFSACEIWVAASDNVDGYCAFRPGWVDHLCLRPEIHRQGFGTALLGRAMADNEHLRLWTFQRNADAIPFYRARGFRVERETDGSGNEEHEPDVLFAWHAAGEH